MTQRIIKANGEIKDTFMALSLNTKECANAVMNREQEKFDEAILERWILKMTVKDWGTDILGPKKMIHGKMKMNSLIPQMAS